MKFYDISVALQEPMPSWPGEQGFAKKEKRAHTPVRVTEISMSVHAGTHIDAPYHFLPDGKKISDYPIERFAGKARVCQIQDEKCITEKELRRKNLKHVEKLLFKTRNSILWNKKSFDKTFVGLEFDAVKYLISLGISLVGIDYLSIEGYGSMYNLIHTNLLMHEILILEGLDLLDVPEGDYYLVCFPLKVAHAEAAPVRAVLMSEEI